MPGCLNGEKVMRNKSYLLFLVLIVTIALPAACSQQDTAEGHIIYAKITGPGILFLEHEWWSIETDGSNPRKFDISAAIYTVRSNPGENLVLFLKGEESYVAEPDGSNPRSVSLPELENMWIWSPDGLETVR